jgi:hypothetical protein
VAEGDKACGVVSSTDILAAVARDAQRGSNKGEKPRKRRR